MFLQNKIILFLTQNFAEEFYIQWLAILLNHGWHISGIVGGILMVKLIFKDQGDLSNYEEYMNQWE